MPYTWRLLDSGFVAPPESVALDEAILEAHTQGLVPDTLHFYRRSVPMISVGYFQRIEDSLDLEECRKRGVSVIRRKSGGSSIYTDSGQLIYGLVVYEDEVPRDPGESFKMVCTALAGALAQFGVEARYRPMNDIEVGGKKVSGNAQLRRKGSVLQHGTVIIDSDLTAMDAVLSIGSGKAKGLFKPSDRVASLARLAGRRIDVDDVKARIVEQIERVFSVSLKPAGLSDWEKAQVAQLVAERYSRDDWNLKF